MNSSIIYNPRHRAARGPTLSTMNPATIDDGSGTADYAQPGAVPLTKEITKRGKASPAPTMASKGITVARDKFGVDEIAGSGGGVSMPKTPMTASAVNPTARIMSPGDLVSEAINRMPLGVRRKDQPAMLAAIMHGMTAANNAMAHAGSEFARADLAAQTGMADVHSDLAANVHAAGINKDLGVMKNESDMAQLSETKRHNRAAEGIDLLRAFRTGIDDTDKEARKDRKADLKSLTDDYGKLSEERTKQYAKDAADFEERAAQAKAFGKPTPAWQESAAHQGITSEMYRVRDIAAQNHGYDVIKRRPVERGLTIQPKAQTGGFVYRGGKLIPQR